MNKQLKRLILLFFFGLFFGLGHGQIQKEKLPLVQLLQELEIRYGIKFSYETSIIDSIELVPLETKLTLAQAIQRLRIITNLKFEVLSERFVAIIPNLSKDLLNETHQLDEVVIQNYLTKGLNKTVNGAINVNSNSFDLIPGLIEPDVLQIIQNLPGIQSVDERISNINVRGGTNDQNLILYEGIRMFQTGHFFGLISAFNPYLTEGVTLSKNGTSARFGDGVSSTIIINNSDEINKTNTFGLGGNLLNVDGLTNIALTKKMALQLSLRRSYTDLLVSKTYDAYFDRIFRDSELNSQNNRNTLLSLDERFLFYDVNGKFLYNINASSKFRFNILNINNHLDYNRIFTTTDNSIQETRSALNQASFGVSATYNKSWRNDLTTSIQLYYSNYKLDAINNDLTNESRIIQQNEVDDYGLRIDLSKTIDALTKVNSGYQLNEVGVSNLEDVSNPLFTSFNKKILRTHAIFSEIEWKSDSKDSYLKFGARISYYEKLAQVVMEPRVSFNQKIADFFRLEILGELKSQSITQIIDVQQDFFGIEKRRWQLANNDEVPLIKSQQASVGFSYNFNGLLISAEGYYKNVSNITARSQGFQNQFQFTNDIGSYNILGADFLINKRYKNFKAWLSYTFSNNKYQFKNLNNSKAFANTLDLTHAINTSFVYNLENLKLGIGFNWHSGRPYTKPAVDQNLNNSEIEYKDPNRSRLKDYFRTDISATYSFKLFKYINADVGASVWNIFNRTNLVNRFYKEDSNNSILKTDSRSLKFTPNFSFRVRF
ncbi:MAG: TonB-dependent receptor plug domain-containing protein [Winogradskyella sp.]|uniref:TonB-dependent receptor plug domain-containing protein n=1 Tax=Winogradskyella sp. TaxID=1883156 RepID=UPI001832F8F9|nr:TonB-dependent receptor plug domain-containing protein [Winogradskyella sp.]